MVEKKHESVLINMPTPHRPQLQHATGDTQVTEPDSVIDSLERSAPPPPHEKVPKVPILSFICSPNQPFFSLHIYISLFFSLSIYVIDQFLPRLE